MKRIALGLLLGAAVVYGVATVLQPYHAAWGYVAAFAEAAMIGAIADWFAVVALFRHPLGLPIPHTAIIPSNKDRIGENLATFICANFLSTEQVVAKVAALKPAARLARWLAEPRNAASLAGHLSAMVTYAIGVLEDERVRAFFRAAVVGRLQQIDVARLGGQLLDVLTAGQRHQQLLDATLRQLGRLLDDPTLKAQVAEVVAAEVKYLRFVGLDTVAGRYATEKMIAAVVRLIGAMGADPSHPLRIRFDDAVAAFVRRLQEDPAMREKGEVIKQDLLHHPVVGDYLQGLWGELMTGLRADLTSEASSIRAQLALGACRLGSKLADDPAMQEWIDEQIRAAAPRWIERYREDIRSYIVARVTEWNADEMTRELERNIGRDLQFIRINGTLVGGLVGLVIHAATEWIRG